MGQKRKSDYPFLKLCMCIVSFWVSEKEYTKALVLTLIGKPNMRKGFPYQWKPFFTLLRTLEAF